jgi:membrane-bound lytic murein transglycosylase A
MKMCLLQNKMRPFVWGAGADAGAKAGAMKQAGKIWVLLPKEFVLK